MRLVLVAIEDNDDADTFVKAVNGGEILISFEKNTGDGTGEYGYKGLIASAEGVWAAPTQFCECTDYAGKNGVTKAYKWYVHTKCSKPRRGAQQSPRNLLEGDILPRDRRYSLSFMADRSKGWSYTAGQESK